MTTPPPIIMSAVAKIAQRRQGRVATFCPGLVFSFCVKRSIIIAKITNPRPLTKPEPTSARCTADNTPRPRPGAPIIDAVTTIDNANIIVWFAPAKIVFLAFGNSSLINFCQVVDPKESAASTNATGTCRIPKSVILTIGGSANIIEANTPGTTPIPKKATAGIK